MSKPKILLQLDTDPQPSVFDSVVAVDADVAHLFRHGGITPKNVQALVHGAIFTRGGEDLKHTAIFIGGSNVNEGAALLEAVRRTFFGPVRVSTMLDSNGANTTASAAVLAAAKHIPLEGTTVLVLGGTGPVGQRVARLLARQGAVVRVGSRAADKAMTVCVEIAGKSLGVQITPHATSTPQEIAVAMAGTQVVISAGAAGVEMLSLNARTRCPTLAVAIDLNAVPPVGLAGIDMMDRGKDHNGVFCYGAIGIGGMKMKIHKAAIKRLFAGNDLILDAEEIYAIGQSLGL